MFQRENSFPQQRNKRLLSKNETSTTKVKKNDAPNDEKQPTASQKIAINKAKLSSDKPTAVTCRVDKLSNNSNSEDESDSNHSKLPKTFTKEEIQQMSTHNQKKLPTYINPPKYKQHVKKKVSIADEPIQIKRSVLKDSMESLDKPSDFQSYGKTVALVKSLIR